MNGVRPTEVTANTNRSEPFCVQDANADSRGGINANTNRSEPFRVEPPVRFKQTEARQERRVGKVQIDGSNGSEELICGTCGEQTVSKALSIPIKPTAKMIEDHNISH